MSVLSGKLILVAIPKSQFEEGELLPLREILIGAGARVFVLSKSGQAARGMEKTSFQPDGTIVDWDKQPGVVGKYHAVVVLGGRGASKSLWEDPILPQILTDHFRAERIVAAMGEGAPVLVRAGLCGEDDLPEPGSSEALVVSGRVLLAAGKNAMASFLAALTRLLTE